MAMAAPWLRILFSILIFANPSLQFLEYRLNQSIYNIGYTLDLDNGLRGRATPFSGNVSATNDATHGIFFVTQDGVNYSLAVLAYDYNAGDAYSAEIIWSANQSRSVGDGAVLQLGLDGNMLLNDANGETVWQTYSANKGVRQLEVSDRGNIVLSNITHDKIWMTFDSPSDTMICSQVLRQGMHLSNGDYSLVLDHTRLSLLYKSSFTYQEWSWDSSVLNSSQTVFLAFCCDTSKLMLQLRSDFANVNQMNKLLNVTNCSTEDSVVNTLLELKSSNELSYAAFVKLDADGQLTASKWVIRKQKFQSCDLPRSCGSYGLCNRRACTCPSLTHFQYIDPSKPQAGCRKLSDSNTGSCKLTDSVDKTDYFATKYAGFVLASTVDDCRGFCLQNHSCEAGFYQLHTKKCFQFSEVETLRAENSSYVAFFKICTSTRSRFVIILTSSLGGLTALAILLVIVYIARQQRIAAEEDADSVLNLCLSETSLKRFTYKELREITKNFSDMLGKGGFGPVYKGALANGTLVAVKKLEAKWQSAKEFYAEVSVLSRVHHMNLVQLIGFCANKSQRSLVYEYMANGSLDRWINPHNESTLNWKMRLDIAIGVAKGIAYLHEECSQTIVHLDVKPQNILLNEDFVPKVGDFGLSKLIDRDESVVMTAVKGTRGYLAPEWFTEGAISEKSDVYSFGVVLLEILGGSKTGGHIGKGDSWGWNPNDKEICEFADPRILEALDVEQAKCVVKIAALCVQQDPHVRPAMSDVVALLEGRLNMPQLRSQSSYINISEETEKTSAENVVRLAESSTSTSLDMSFTSKSNLFVPR